MKLTASIFSLLLLLLALALLGPATPAQDPAGQDADEQELETFVPSEKLPADSAVSFPVDI